jgi:5-methylcytosine-specific restriction endonuclease McrA
MVAMADLAVELGHDDGGTLLLTKEQLAEKFIELYWQQATPYSATAADQDLNEPIVKSSSFVLAQNKGIQTAIVKNIIIFRAEFNPRSLIAAKTITGFKQLRNKVSATVMSKPVTHLQNLGGQAEPFLYNTLTNGIELLPGVAYCLRRFQPLVQQLSRNGWINHIKGNRLNQSILGEQDDLESFLFGTSRKSLLVISAGLRKISNKCFYCQQTLRSEADVDHFIPFSQYPRDLMHNFVIAHPACNRSKSNALAAREHLERWVEYIDREDANLTMIGKDAGKVTDLPVMRAVARWGYGNAVQSSAKAWIRATNFESVNKDYLDILDVI